MRTTLLGSLLDVAARNLARGREAVALFEAGAVYLRGTPPESGGPLAGNFPGDTPAPVTEPHRYGALAVGPLVPQLLARRRRAGRLLRPQGRARGARRRARLPAAGVRAGERAVPAPGPQRRGLDRRHAARLARRGPPAGLPDLGHRRRGRLRNRRRAAARRGDPRRGGLRGPDHLPGDPPGPRDRRPDRDQRGEDPRRR